MWYFWSKKQGLLVFHQTIPKKYGLKASQIRHFWSQTKSFVLYEPFYFENFDDVDLKYDNSFFKYQSKNT